MNLTLLTRSVLIVLLCICSSTYAQSDATEDNTTTSKLGFLYDNERQKSVSWSLSYQLPMPTGDNYIGQGYDGDYGFKFNTKVFVFKQLYVGYTFGINRFTVRDTNILGNYRKSRVATNVFNVGYEFLPIKKLRLGTNFGFGYIRFKNWVNNNSSSFIDNGNLFVFGLYTAYELSDTISFFIDYSINNVNSNIDSPSTFNDFFEKGKYNTLNFGITVALGKDDVVSAVAKTYNLKK